MAKSMKKLLSLALAVVMVLSMIPAVSAEEEVVKVYETDDLLTPLTNGSEQNLVADATYHYQLQNDVTMDTAKALYIGKYVEAENVTETNKGHAVHVVLDLNGKTLTDAYDGGAKNRMFALYSGSSITVRNGKIVSNTSIKALGGVFFAIGGSDITLENVTIETSSPSTSMGGVIYTTGSGCVVTLNNSTITRTAGDCTGNGSIIAMEGGTLNLNNSHISGGRVVQTVLNKAAHGGNIYLTEGAVATMNGGSITGGYVEAATATNMAPSSGGNVFVNGKGTKFILNSGTISGGEAKIIGIKAEGATAYSTGYATGGNVGIHGYATATASRAYFEMNGGEVINGKSTYGTGGKSGNRRGGNFGLYGNANVIINDGLVTGGSAYRGTAIDMWTTSCSAEINGGTIRGIGLYITGQLVVKGGLLDQVGITIGSTYVSYVRVYGGTILHSGGFSKAFGGSKATSASGGSTGWVSTTYIYGGKMNFAPQTLYGDKVDAESGEVTSVMYRGVVESCSEIIAPTETEELYVVRHKDNDTTVTIAATCEEAGSVTTTCTDCDYSRYNTKFNGVYTYEIPALGHNYVGTQTKAPSCTEEGVMTYVCANDETHTYTEAVDALGHTEEIMPGKAATCTEAGLTEGKKCTVCGEITVAQETIDALGHTEKVVEGKEPTCTDTGLTEGKVCEICGETLVAQEVIASTGHAWDEGVIDPAPTCNGEGVKTYTCGTCGETKTEVVDATGHTAVIDEAKAPTCTETGLTEGIHCDVCGEIIVAQELVDALGHTEEIIPGKAATCTETGLTEGKKCSVCGETIVAQEIIDALGHTEEIIPGKAATCTETGLTEGKKCTVCGEITVAQETIDALGHTEEIIPGKAATCTDTGLTEGKKCSVCGEVIVAQEEIAALGHSYSGVYTEPTYEADGYTTYTCSVCGDSYVETDEGTKLNAAARIGDAKYETLAAAVEAAAEGDTIVVLTDVVLTETLVIPAEKTVILDLAGCTVSMEDASGKAAQLIKNNGDLTVMDSLEGGKLTFVSTTPSASYGYSTSTIVNSGNLTIVSGTVESTTNGGASYAIDNAWYTEDVSLTVQGGTVKAERIAIRQVLFSTTAKNTVNIIDGVIDSGYAGLQVHNYQTTACLSDVNISGGIFNGTYAFYTSYSYNNTATGTDIEISGGTFNGYVFLYNGNAGSAEYPMTISVTGGTFNGGYYAYCKDADSAEVAIPSVTGGTHIYDVTDYCVEGYGMHDNGDGTYGVHQHIYNGVYTEPTYEAEGYTTYTCSVCGDSYVETDEGTKLNAAAQIGETKYETLAKAVEAAAEGSTVKLLADVTLTEQLTVSKALTLDLNGFDITGNVVGAYGMIYVGMKGNLTVVSNPAVAAFSAEGSEITNEGGYAIGNYGTVSVENVALTGADTALYNFYYNAATYGKATLGEGASANSIWNCGELTVAGAADYIDNSGALTVTGAVSEIYAQDGSDASEVPGAGTITIADTSAVTVPEGYMLQETETAGTYQVVEKPAIMVTYADGTVEYFDDMREAVPHSTNVPRLEGATITLLEDMSGLGMRLMENGMVFDLNGHTYTLTGGTGSQGTETSGFQIRPEVTGTATIKNGTIKVAEGVAIAWMFNSYAANFVVEDVIVDCANMDYGYGSSVYAHVSHAADDNTVFTGTTQFINFNSEVAGSAINVAGTMTIDETVTPGGAIELDAGASVTAAEDLDVVTVDGYIVKYANGTYTSVQAVAQIGETYYATFEEAVANIATDGSDTTIKLLTDIEVDQSISCSYGDGKIIFTADKPVTVKQTAVADIDFTKSANAVIVIGENVTFQIYDNASGMYLYYGPSIEVSGTVTGGENWGVLYLYQGEHTVTETGTVSTGRVQIGHTTLTVQGTIDSNYLLVEASELIANGAVIDAGAIHDSNNGGARWGASTMDFLNGTNVTANTVKLAYADSVITLDLTSTITANTLSGIGKIVIDAAAFDGNEVTVITADMTGFTGEIEVINSDTAAYELADGVLKIVKTKIKPNATVTVQDQQTLKAGEYSIFDGDLKEGTEDMPLEVVMNFKAEDTLEECLAGGYSDWLVDFNITFTGMSGDTITANNCYLAGNYGSFGWIVIPTDGLVLDNGVSYPVVSAYDASLNYKDICNSVKNFTAAIHIDQAILDANPDLEVKLELVMTNPADAEDKLYIGEPAVYTAEDLMNGVVAKNRETGKRYTDLTEALRDAENATVVLLDDVTVGNLAINFGVTLDLNGYTLNAVRIGADSTSHIVDSTNGKGLLTVSGTFTLNEENAAIPVKTTDGYRFTSLEIITRYKDVEDYKLFGAYFVGEVGEDATSMLATQLADGGADNNLTVRVKLTYTSLDESTSGNAVFNFSDALVQQYAAKWEKSEFLVNVRGAEKVANLQAVLEIVAVVGDQEIVVSSKTIALQ